MRGDLRRIEELRFNNHLCTLDRKTKILVPEPSKRFREMGLVIRENSRGW